MYLRLLKVPSAENRSFFLFGPRGTGKTTWLEEHLPDAQKFDLLRSDVFARLSSRPEDLRKLISPDPQEWIVIDEVQKVPALLNEVHSLIESSGYKFALTGSSARSLRKQGVNLLAGRASTYYMYPLTATEQGESFVFEDSLLYGNLPGRFAVDNPGRFLADYTQTYVREEVLQEGLTRNIGSFNRFLEVASLSQGSILNTSGVARDVALSRHVVENYFSILEDLLLASYLPVFSRKAKRSLVNKSKFYFFDVGVYRSLRPQGPLDSTSEVDGAAIETLVLQELRAVNEYFDLGYELYYWRTRSGLEVDFVLYGPKGLIAIEVKRKRTLSSKDFRSLKEFAADYPVTKSLLLHGGSSVEYHGNVIAVPLNQALAELPTLLSE